MAHSYLIARNVRSNNPTIEESARPGNGIINWVEGLVHSRHVGVTRTAVRVRIGRRIDLSVKLPIDDERCFFAGQEVIAMIPAEAVRLEAGLFRRSRQHLNRWYGRIVLIEPPSPRPVITAKFMARVGLSSAQVLSSDQVNHPGHGIWSVSSSILTRSNWFPVRGRLCLSLKLGNACGIDNKQPGMCRRPKRRNVQSVTSFHVRSLSQG